MNSNRTNLAEKVVIVTGAGVGMGAATARLLAARGAKVAVSDINKATAQNTCDEIPAEGGTATVIVCDVSREDQVEALIAQTVAAFGRLDCAVNNAAITPDVLPIAEADMLWLRPIFADGGYAGDKLRQALRRIGKWTVEIVRRSDAAKGFVALPRRWVVERTLAWLSRNRRLAKDFEQTIASATAWLFIASIQLFARRIARS